MTKVESQSSEVQRRSLLCNGVVLFEVMSISAFCRAIELRHHDLNMSLRQCI